MPERPECFIVCGAEFVPTAKLHYVDEPEFGCEGAPENDTVYGSIVMEDAHGRRTVKIEETTLFASRFDDGMWVGSMDGKPVLVNRKQTEVLEPNAAECGWLRSMGLL